ncbi:MAG: glucose 1-dehydrogenase [Pseudomonadota bacterium]
MAHDDHAEATGTDTRPSYDGRLYGKTAVITGAGSGFGEGIAHRFADEGAKVLVVDIDAERAERVAADINARRQGAAKADRADVSDALDVENMLRTAENAFGEIDILINNAGVSHRNQPMLEVEEEEFDRVYAVNVKALYHAAKAIVPRFRARAERARDAGGDTPGGVILTIASTAAARPRPGLVWYSGTKGAAVTITKSMAVELAPERIRVNAINPVMGETALLETFMGVEDTEETRARFIAGIPLGRMSRPLDIANAAVFLCSDEAEFLTGVALDVDGGRSV